MCNPRRIRVRGTRQLAEAWDQEVRRQVTRVRDVVAEARVRERLDSSVGAPTLAALAAVLHRTEGWEQDDEGVFRYALTGGYVAFDARSRELEIVARQSAEISAVGEAVTTVRGELADTVRGVGQGTYYDDGYRGITEADARRAAGQALDRSLSDAAATLRAQARADADERAGQGLLVEAERQADAALASASAARADELRRQAAASLTSVGIEGRNVFNLALAEAYRDAILAFARARRASNVQCTESGGVVEIEFEMQV
ncbi:MAG TPA: hypothetical protein VFQ44_11910 [Streptosporangiaceae bacterium]|nr:hypothetical protein [Streptosporangiaceae bacterium]